MPECKTGYITFFVGIDFQYKYGGAFSIRRVTLEYYRLLSTPSNFRIAGPESPAKQTDPDKISPSTRSETQSENCTGRSIFDGQLNVKQPCAILKAAREF